MITLEDLPEIVETDKIVRAQGSGDLIKYVSALKKFTVEYQGKEFFAFHMAEKLLDPPVNVTEHEDYVQELLNRIFDFTEEEYEEVIDAARLHILKKVNDYEGFEKVFILDQNILDKRRVSRSFALSALAHFNLLDQVEAYMTSSDRSAEEKIFFENALTWSKDNEILKKAVQSLGLSNAQFDELFSFAVNLEIEDSRKELEANPSLLNINPEVINKLREEPENEE